MEDGDSTDKVGGVSEQVNNMMPLMVDGYKRNIWRERSFGEVEDANLDDHFYTRHFVDVANLLVYKKPTTHARQLQKKKLTQ